MEILNIDDLMPKSKRAIKLGGVEHEVVEMSVQMFIESVAEANKLKQLPHDSTEHLESTIRLVNRAIPSLAADVIRSLPMDVLGTIVQFINGELDEEIKKGKAAQDESEGEEAAGGK